MGAAGKVLGALMLIVGVLAVLVGLGAAGFGFMDQQDHEEQLLEDPDRTEQNQMLMLGGGASAGLGILLLIIGAILLAVGGPQVVAITGATGTAPATEPVAAKKKWLAPSIAIGVVVLLLIGGFMFTSSGASSWGSGGGSGFEAGSGRLLKWENITGNVQGASAGLVGSANAPTSQSIKNFSPDPQTQALEVTLTWQASSTGQTELRLVVEILSNGQWQELGRQQGASPVTVQLSSADVAGASMRASVYATGVGGSASQDFSLAIKSFA